jgi:hypothetical protein
VGAAIIALEVMMLLFLDADSILMAFVVVALAVISNEPEAFHFLRCWYTDVVFTLIRDAARAMSEDAMRILSPLTMLAVFFNVSEN